MRPGIEAPQLSGRSRVDRHPVWRDAGSQMAPNCSRPPPGTISQGFGHRPPRWARLSRFLCYPSTNRAPRVGHSLGIARGGARNWCPRRALGPMNSAWAKGRGRRAALRRTAAFVIDSSGTEAKSSSAQYCPSSDGRGDRIERLLSLHELFTGSPAPLSGASSASRSRTVAYSAARRFQRRTPARSESR